MWKRLTIVLAVAMAASLLAAPALAVENTATDEAELEGVGVIWARGKGTAVLDGAGKVWMRIRGDVLIVDRAGDAVVYIRPRLADGTLGERETLAVTTRYELDNFNGRLFVRGSDFRIEAEGRMKFKGKGKGHIELDGRGVWHTRHAFGTWNGRVIRF